MTKVVTLLKTRWHIKTLSPIAEKDNVTNDIMQL